jgi:tetratricopeptide (TPR) repeat protein
MALALFAIGVCGLFFLNGSAALQAHDSPTDVLDRSALSSAEFGRYDDAVKLYRKELNLLLAGGQRSEAGNVYVSLAEISHVRGEFPAAEENYKRGIDLLQHYGRADNPFLVRGLDGLGWLYETWGRSVEALRTMGAASAAADRARLDPTNLMGHLDTQAAFLAVTSRYSEAMKKWNRALQVRSSNFGSGSIDFDILLLHSGQASAMFGDYRRAEELFRDYISIEERVSTQDTISRAVASAELGHVEVALHNWPEAQHWLDHAVAVFNRVPNQTPLFYSMVLSYHGDLDMAQRKWSQAEQEFRKALDIRKRVLGENLATAESMLSLSAALRKLHCKQEAKEWTARAKAITAAEKNPFQNQTVDVLALRGQ